MLSFSSYFSPGYLALYLPAAVLLYALAGQRGRRAVLLLFSYVCFWAVSGKLIAYLLLSTLSMYHTGLWLAHDQARTKELLEETPKEERRALRARAQTKQRRILALGLLFQLGMLVVLKYTPFFLSNYNALLQALSLPVTLRIPHFLLPIGISFYTMQAASYLFDVYRQKVPADRNLFRLALYLSFFPLLMEGPICRYQQTAQQLWEAPPLRYQNLMLGLQRMSYGLLKKILVADRLNLFIKTVFDHYEDYDGLVIAVAAVCYTIQLYMDFSGTMDLAVGAGRIFGFHIPDNFQRPFFSRSILWASPAPASPIAASRWCAPGSWCALASCFSGPMDCTTGWLCFIRWSPSFLWHVSAAGACSRWVCGRRIFCSWRFFWLCLCWWESPRSVASTLERACGSRRLCCVWRSTTPSFWL